MTPGEIIDFPEDNPWEAEPGPSKSVSKGFLFVARGMSVGDHSIVVRAFFDGTFALEVVWDLHVEAAA